MSAEVDELLQRAASGPVPALHTGQIIARGRRRRRVLQVTVAATALVVAGVVSVGGAAVLSFAGVPRDLPVIGDGPASSDGQSGDASEPIRPKPDAPVVPPTTSHPVATDIDLATPRPVANDPDPVARAGASGRQVDCDGPVHLGGWSPDFGGPGTGAADPRGALQAFLEMGFFGLPADGYTQAAAAQDRVLFTYQNDGLPKVAVIVADASAVDGLMVETGWIIETFATCDPAEYAPSADDELYQTVWTDRDGNRVPISTITSFPGPAHCNWQTVTFLYLDDRQYLRDPAQVLTQRLVMPFDNDMDLPPDAIDTGYRRGREELWLAADETIAYVVTANRVEAWPSTTGPVACA